MLIPTRRTPFADTEPCTEVLSEGSEKWDK